MSIPIHPAIEPYGFLLGTWKGEGEGGFPTINSFKYGEEIKFWHSGKPVIAYSQKTWKLGSGEPMHAEFGFLRPQKDGALHLVLTQSTGIVEVQKGEMVGEGHLMLSSDLIGNATKVLAVSRDITVLENTLVYTLAMETSSEPLQNHLKATLQKVT